MRYMLVFAIEKSSTLRTFAKELNFHHLYLAGSFKPTGNGLANGLVLENFPRFLKFSHKLKLKIISF